MKPNKTAQNGQVFLTIGNLLLVGSLALSGYFFFQAPEIFKTTPLLKILIYTLPSLGLIFEVIGLTRIKSLGSSSEGDWNFLISSLLILISIPWFLFSPNRANKNLTNFLNSSAVLTEVETLSALNSPQPSLAEMAGLYSIVVISKNGDNWQISNLNKSIPGKFRAAGEKKLKYVVILEEIPAGEVLSDKWQAYYKRGMQVSDPKPVKYIHFDWRVVVVDIQAQQVVLKEVLSAEPPDEYRKPLESIVYVKPSTKQFLDLLGFKSTTD